MRRQGKIVFLLMARPLKVGEVVLPHLELVQALAVLEEVLSAMAVAMVGGVAMESRGARLTPIRQVEVVVRVATVEVVVMERTLVCLLVSLVLLVLEVAAVVGPVDIIRRMV